MLSISCYNYIWLFCLSISKAVIHSVPKDIGEDGNFIGDEWIACPSIHLLCSTWTKQVQINPFPYIP